MISDVIVIMTDQQRADLSRRWGYALDTTPRLDALAAEGVWFDRAYTTAPACMPARESLLTGRWPSAHGVRTNFQSQHLRATTDLWRHFRAHGWRVGLFGKNHTHLTPADGDRWEEGWHGGAADAPSDPEFGAFDRYLRAVSNHGREPAPFPRRCQIPFRLVDHCLRFLGDGADRRPSLSWLSFPEPHGPYQVPEPYWSLFPPESLPPLASSAADGEALGPAHRWCLRAYAVAYPGFASKLPRQRSIYHGMLRLIDDAVAHLLDELARRGRRERTLLVFLADHGDFVGEYGLMRKGAGIGEALMRIPLLVAGPGVVRRSGPHPAHVSIADIFPTLCDAAGISIPCGVQGRSLWPMLRGEPYDENAFASVLGEQGYGGMLIDGDDPRYDPAADRFDPASDGKDGRYDCLNSCTQSGTMRALRCGRWKLIVDARGRVALHDLERDPAELRDLTDDPAQRETLARLMREMLLWTARLADPLPIPGGTLRLKEPRTLWRSDERAREPQTVAGAGERWMPSGASP